MEKEIISSMSVSITESQLGDSRRNDEAWEEVDGGAHFRVCRHLLPVKEGGVLEILSMSVSGLPRERSRVIDEFSDVFGLPESRTVVSDTARCVEFVLWLIDEE